MSEMIPPQLPEEENYYEANIEIFRLAEMCEAFAQTYSDDYARGYEDGITVTKGTTELGGLLSSTTTLSVNRLRGSLPSGVPDEVAVAEYVISSTVSQDGISYVALPESVKEYVNQFEDFADEDYDELTEASLIYEQSHFITSDGDYNFDYSLTLDLDGEKLMLPETAGELEMLEDDQEMSEGAHEVFADESDAEQQGILEGIFSADEVLAIQAMTKRVVDEHYNVDALGKFYAQMENMRFLSSEAKYHMAQNILRQIFTEPEEL